MVHSPNDPLKLEEHYDEDRILYLMDWMYVSIRGMMLKVGTKTLRSLLMPSILMLDIEG